MVQTRRCRAECPSGPFPHRARAGHGRATDIRGGLVHSLTRDGIHAGNEPPLAGLPLHRPPRIGRVAPYRSDIRTGMDALEVTDIRRGWVDRSDPGPVEQTGVQQQVPRQSAAQGTLGVVGRVIGLQARAPRNGHRGHCDTPPGTDGRLFGSEQTTIMDKSPSAEARDRLFPAYDQTSDRNRDPRRASWRITCSTYVNRRRMGWWPSSFVTSPSSLRQAPSNFPTTTGTVPSRSTTPSTSSSTSSSPAITAI